MAIQGATQALIAAFAFGIIVNAAAGGLFLNIKGQGSVLRDGLRLVLVTFFLSSALWAQIDFISSFIDTEATSSCQAAAVIATIFDQLARFAIEQCLLWAINAGVEASKGQMVAQGLLVVRFILGGVFAGLVRPQFKPVCVPMSSVLPMAIITIALDAVIIATLAGRAVSVGVLKNARQDAQGSGRGKAILLVIAAFAIWTGTSVAMLLGSTDIELVFRTTVPAVGLFFMILATAAASQSITIPKDNRSARLPEAPSPRRINTSRDISSSDSIDYPPSRYEDLKGEQAMSAAAFVRPREAPLPRTEDNGIMGAGVSRINGMPVRGELFPPVKEFPVQETRRVEIRPLNKHNKSGNISISNPVLLQSGGSNPLERIPTIGLQEAARADRERRAMMALQRQSTTLIAQRAAPQPPYVPPEEAIKRSISTRRKDVASGIIFTDGATLTATSSTTSAQLSPGVEEIRRRSPRQPPMPTQATPVAPRPRSPEQRQQVSTPPEQFAGPVRTIRPSRQRPLSPQSPPPEPVKMPLQRRETIGLPNNPRAHSIRKLSKEADKQSQQTVMLINNIVYDDPTLVQSVMNGPSETEFKMPFPGTAATRGSVVNRPRPIPRKQELEALRIIHRRSKSFNAIPTRKSILRSHPGSPTQLPPLPPPPKSAGNPGRPHPNDTKSMTFDEKMTMFFPAPPSTNRKSPISEMPSIPASFWGTSPTESDNDTRSRKTRNSNRTTRTSARTENIFDISEVDELPQRDVSAYDKDYRLPARVYGDLGDDLDRYSFKTESIRAPVSAAGKRASSPVIPLVRESKVTVGTTTRDDETTNWGSVHSPAAAQNISLTLQKARSTYIQRSEGSDLANRAISGISSDDGELPVMLDASVYTSEVSTSKASIPSDQNQASQVQWHRRIGDELPSFSARPTRTKSRRIPPTPLLLNGKMSAGKQAILIQAAEPSPLESPEAALQAIQAQLRKYEEPNRDSVGSEGQRRIALLENLEMEMGQQESRWLRLQHDLARDSISTLRTTPSVDSRPASINTATTIREHSALPSAIERRNSRRERKFGGAAASSRAGEIQSLEASIASLWKRRQAETEEELMDNASNFTGGRSLNFRAVSKADLGSPTPPDTDESDQEIDMQQSIAYVLLQAQFKPVPKPLWTAPASAPAKAAGYLWTPPVQAARVHVAQVELPNLSIRPPPRKASQPLEITSKRLWQHPLRDLSHNLPGLWIPPYKRAQALARSSSQREASHTRHRTPAPKPLAQRPPRRSRRITLLPDIVENPEPLPNKRDTLGIFQFPWGERSDTAVAAPPARPAMFAPMPGTMTSGAARAQQQAVVVAAAAAALEGGGGDDGEDSASSFFDDYDDEDETLDGATAYDEDEDEDDYDEMGSSSGDDDFDESTLWEIASLLKTSNVPSRLSMFPPALPEAVVDDYIIEIEYDEGSSPAVEEPEEAEEEEEQQQHWDHLELAPTKPLWTAREKLERGSHGVGLPQPDARTWQVYSSAKETARARRRRAEEAGVESSRLWQPSTVRMESAETGTWSQKSALWVARREKQKGAHGKGLPQPGARLWAALCDSTTATVRTRPHRAEPAAAVQSTSLWKQASVKTHPAGPGLWSPKPLLWVARQGKKMGAHGMGLPQPDVHAWRSYDNVKETLRARPRRARAATIESTSLWGRTSAKPPRAALWAARKRAEKGQHGRGLPQPSEQVWTFYDSVKETLRTKPRMPAEPATIQSTALWGQAVTKPALWAAQKRAEKGEHGRGLPQPSEQAWALYDSVKETLRTKPRMPAEPATIQSTALWGQAAAKPALWVAGREAKKGEHGRGLPQPGKEAWARYDGVQATARARPRRAEPAGALESDGLWRPSPATPAPEPGFLWSSRVPRPVSRRGEAPGPGGHAALWTAPGPARASLRTTAAEPAAALATARTPRPARGGGRPLQRLTSASLWSAAPRSQERHWLSAASSAAPRPRAGRRPAPRRRAASPAEWAAALDRAVAASYPPRSGGGGGADPAVVARIAALEEERLFAQRFAQRSMMAFAAAASAASEAALPPLPAGALWTKPAAGVEPLAPRAMWRPRQARRRGAAPAPCLLAGTAPHRRREQRRDAAETVAVFKGQGMWARAGEPRPERDWLAEGALRRS